MKNLLTLLFAIAVVIPSVAQQKATGTVSKGEAASAETVHLSNKKETKKAKTAQQNAAKKKAASKTKKAAAEKASKVWK